MRYCIVGPAYPLRGGIAHHTTLVGNHLAEKHQVTAIGFSRLYPALLFPGKSQKDPSQMESSIKAMPVIDSIQPLTWLAASKRIREAAPDWVLIQWWHPFFGPCLASIASRARRHSKVGFICHNVVPHEGMPFARALSLRTLRHGDGFIVHSGQDRKDLESLLPGLSPDAVRKTIHPRYDIFPSTGMDQRQARSRLGVTGKVVLFFGLVRAYKGLIDLIEAMALVRTQGITCLVVGEFYEKEEPYAARIRELGLSDAVRITNRYVANEEVEQYFAAADLVVLPYRSATQSGVVQIAHTFERPVIATTVGGLPEAIQDGRTGILVPPNDPQSLAQAIDRYFLEGLEARFVNGIRQDRDRFSWDRVTETIEELSNRCMWP